MQLVSFSVFSSRKYLNLVPTNIKSYEQLPSNKIVSSNQGKAAAKSDPEIATESISPELVRQKSVLTLESIFRQSNELSLFSKDWEVFDFFNSSFVSLKRVLWRLDDGRRLLRVHLQPWDGDEEAPVLAPAVSKLLHRQRVHPSKIMLLELELER